MRLDDTVRRRFEELETKAAAVAATRQELEHSGPAVDVHLAKAWAMSALSLLQRAFGETSVHYRQLSAHLEKPVSWSGTEHAFLGAKAILDAAREDYLGGYLFNLTEIIHADVFTDYLEAADHLTSEGYKDPAAVIAGSTLEQHLRALCKKHGVAPLDANGRPKKADLINSELAGAGVYGKGDQKNVTAWLDLRNNASHGHYGQYTKEQVALLIQSVRDFITRNPA